MSLFCSLDCFIPCGPSIQISQPDFPVENIRREIVSSNLANLKKPESKVALPSPGLIFSSTDKIDALNNDQSNTSLFFALVLVGVNAPTTKHKYASVDTGASKRTKYIDTLELINSKAIRAQSTPENRIVFDIMVDKGVKRPKISDPQIIIQNQRRETLKAEHQKRFEEKLDQFKEKSPYEKKDYILHQLKSICFLRNQSECFGEIKPDEISLSLKEDAKKEFGQLKKFYNRLKITEKNDLDHFICSRYKKEINTAASILKRYTDIGVEIKDPEEKHDAKNSVVKDFVDALRNEKNALRKLAKELI